MPDDTVRPAVEVEVERLADPVHGDFASNLAMKLARPYRMAPLAIAAALAVELAAEAASALTLTYGGGTRINQHCSGATGDGILRVDAACTAQGEPCDH